MNAISKRSLGYAFAIFGALSLADTVPALAVSGRDLNSVRGDFGYVVNGTNLGLGAVSAVGRVSADGVGTLAGTDTISVNGTILRRVITGSYELDQDCTGSVIFVDDFGQSTHLDFVLLDKGDEIRLIQTDPDTIITGTARRL